MTLLFVIGGIGLMFGCALAVLLFRRSKRLKQRQLMSNAQAEGFDDADNEPFDDGFYCIMLTDGTTRTGFINQPKTKLDS